MWYPRMGTDHRRGAVKLKQVGVDISYLKGITEFLAVIALCPMSNQKIIFVTRLKTAIGIGMINIILPWSVSRHFPASAWRS